MTDQFKETIDNYQNNLNHDRRRFDAIGYIKVALAIVFLFAAYKTYVNQNNAVWKAAAAAALVIQILLWIRQLRLREEISHSKGIIGINQRHISRATGQWTTFADTGEEFVDLTHPYASDLDIVGPKSLFQFLNITHSWSGRQTFARDLLHAGYSKEEISKRQNACRELSEHRQLADELEYCFSRIGIDESTPSLLADLENSRPFLKPLPIRLLLLYFPPVLIGITGLAVILQWNRLFYPLFIMYTIQALAGCIGLPAAGQYLRPLRRLPYKLSVYSDVIDTLEAAEFTSPLLLQIQAGLCTSDVSAAKAMKDLARIANKTDVRSNPVLSLILNLFLLWDLECAVSFSDWKADYAPHCRYWFDSLGTLESLGCFATLTKVCDLTCFPTIAGPPGISAAELGHPLLMPAKRVTNSLQLHNGIMIISGSNMSGKTTFLRTAGINLVLARAGSAVCAKDMTCPVMSPYTSMRIADDLNAGISTFYAELERIKNILTASRQDSTTFFLIDEIFRGTNSVDRLQGARTVITKLNEMGAVGMISTHDLELCELEKINSRSRNYNFAEHYRNGQIYFDYKLRPGKSKTTNAQYLMEMLGIL